MNNQTLLLVALFSVGLAGCSSGTTPAPDPFFGRTTISPPSTLSGSVSSYTPPAVAAAPVDPRSTQASPLQAWQSPPSPNFGQAASVSPPYGSDASTLSSATSQPVAAQPTRPIYLNQSAIDESVRQPNYSPGSTSSYQSPSGTIAAAGSNRATNASQAASPMKIYPSSNFQAVNGKPVREESKISYRSASGSIPQYGDPRSSFGQGPNSRFKNTNSATEAPPWSPSSATQTNSPSVPSDTSGLLNTSRSPERIIPIGLGATQPAASSPTLASSRATRNPRKASEKTLPPIRGYASSRTRTSQTQSASSRIAQSGTASSGSTSAWSRSGSTRRSTTTLSPAIRRPTSIPTFASAGPGEPRILAAPPAGVNIADLPDVARIATRPSDSGSPSGTRRLNYETPATDRSPDSLPVHHDTQVKPVAFTPTVLYSHNEDYSRLRGELDYSALDQRWKLRYISINNEETDDYGGSVILGQTSKFSGFERGDFIEVRGRILSGPQDDWGYARTYEVQEIRRIR